MSRSARSRDKGGPRPGKYPVRFGTAELLADADRANAWLVSVDGVAQSYVDLDDPTNLEFDYVRRLGDVVDCLREGPLDALHVGGAGCTLPRYVAATRPGSRQLVFDADGPMIELVREQLDLRSVARLKVRIEGGREGVASRYDASADLVVVDAFERASFAGGLATVEFVSDVARVLRGDGVVLANVTDGPGLAFVRRFLATVGEVFPHVLLLADPGVLRGRRFGNVVVAASREPLPVDVLTRKAASSPYPARCVAGDELRKLRGKALPVWDADPVASPVPPEDVLRVF
ncbi:fused MFS/spermidine synthase [Amycolatopsis rhabdoformis]|uniref:Fused MFS/spermidine synthase n=1 Tax=Amycolatopsis rhabdoformis TaxID=1448059 RepID=A0ABZ1I262_9PSEU|nr:fused MFS/spermidine synthase [Amycolatopsis rhabdoformis]WSE27887.1 fused MFS/spermidine synthase [Amycolatopsis rhabdoformis]